MFFSSVHRTFSRIDHMLGNKASLNKFKKIEIITSMFSDHNAMKLEINYKKKAEKGTKMWRLNNILLNKQWITEEIKEEIKNIWRQMKMITCYTNSYGMQQKLY